MADSSAFQEITLKIPSQMVTELDCFLGENTEQRNEFILQATRHYLREKRVRHIRESMRRGYMEMAKINLNLAVEAAHAEYEADFTVERLVSGG
ncbi:MAG: antitoxin endoai [Bacilli bacterium]